MSETFLDLAVFPEDKLKLLIQTVTIVDPVNQLPGNQRIFPDPETPACVPEIIEKLGGVDICCGGIGINGHVVFNEADSALSNEEFLVQKTRVLTITPETRTVNAIGDFVSCGSSAESSGY